MDSKDKEDRKMANKIRNRRKKDEKVLVKKKIAVKGMKKML